MLKTHVELEILTDSLSLFNNTESTKAMGNHTVNLELAPLRQSFERKEFILSWVDKEFQIADVLTKPHGETRKVQPFLRKLMEENIIEIPAKCQSTGSSLPTRIWQTDLA